MVFGNPYQFIKNLILTWRLPRCAYCQKDKVDPNISDPPYCEECTNILCHVCLDAGDDTPGEASIEDREGNYICCDCYGGMIDDAHERGKEEGW